MLILSKPRNKNGQLFDPGDVFQLCVNAICEDLDLKNRLCSIRSAVENGAREYDLAASGQSLHIFPGDLTIEGRVEKSEMVKLYNQWMVSERVPARAEVYDEIRKAPKFGICPLCGIGAVETLDHHLPKTKFPILAVCPNNLIPACVRCQGQKMDDHFIGVGDQTLHPYFDDFTHARWLHAKVVQGNTVTFEFEVRCPAGWSSLSELRLKSHLKAFGLHELYAMNAASEHSEFIHQLTRLLDEKGADAVKAELLDRAESAENVRKNSWKCAMLYGCIESEWFCAGGFKNL